VIKKSSGNSIRKGRKEVRYKGGEEGRGKKDNK
jgi:hypothetical protein